jgi:hypothetical protein
MLEVGGQLVEEARVGGEEVEPHVFHRIPACADAGPAS